MPTATKARPAKSMSPSAAPLAKVRAASTLLKQASDPTRLRVLLMLRDGEKNVTEMLDSLENMSQPALSHHLSLGRHGGLWHPRRQGKNNFYGLTDKGRELAELVGRMVGGG
jgi:DNA-binding transcriptional ArsR family regulator